MAGVEWCIDYNQENLNNKIDIISMSLGSTPQRYSSVKDDPMVKAVEAAWNQGIVVCVAAGNSGPDPGTIASPGISELVITVGAMDDRIPSLVAMILSLYFQVKVLLSTVMTNRMLLHQE